MKEQVQQRIVHSKIPSGVIIDRLKSKEQSQRRKEKETKKKLDQEKKQFDEKRVSTNSRVNFMSLTEDEQVERYKNMLNEYYDLKKGLAQKADEYYANLADFNKKREMIEIRHGASSLRRARSIIQKRKYQFQDCEMLLQNLASLIATKKLEGRSLEFDIIYSLIKKPKLRKQEMQALSVKSLSKVKQFFQNSDKDEIFAFFTNEPGGYKREFVSNNNLISNMLQKNNESQPRKKQEAKKTVKISRGLTAQMLKNFDVMHTKEDMNLN